MYRPHPKRLVPYTCLTLDKPTSKHMSTPKAVFHGPIRARDLTTSLRASPFVPFPHRTHPSNRGDSVDISDDCEQIEGKGCREPDHGQAYEAHPPNPHKNHFLLGQLDDLGGDAIGW